MSFSRLFLSRFASVIHFIIFTKKKLLFLLNQFGCSQFFALTLSFSDTSVTCDWLLFFCSCCPAFFFQYNSLVPHGFFFCRLSSGTARSFLWCYWSVLLCSDFWCFSISCHAIFKSHPPGTLVRCARIQYSYNIVPWCLTGKSMWTNTIKMNAKWPCVACSVHFLLFNFFSLFFIQFDSYRLSWVSITVTVANSVVAAPLVYDRDNIFGGRAGKKKETTRKEIMNVYFVQFFFSTRFTIIFISCKHIKTHVLYCIHKCKPSCTSLHSFFSHFNYIEIFICVFDSLHVFVDLNAFFLFTFLILFFLPPRNRVSGCFLCAWFPFFRFLLFHFSTNASCSVA